MYYLVLIFIIILVCNIFFSVEEFLLETDWSQTIKMPDLKFIKSIGNWEYLLKREKNKFVLVSVFADVST